MNQFLSKKIKFYLFVSIILVVFVHGYNLNESYLQPFTIINEPIRFTTFIEYWLANGIFRFVVPLLFIISGYLFSIGDSTPYRIRIKKKLNTLIIPYLIWSAIALGVTYFLQTNHFTSQAVVDAHLDQLGDNRPLNVISWNSLLMRWLLFPIAYQLWFVRCLFFYNLASPLIMKAMIKSPKIWFSVCAFLWVVGFGTPLFEGEGLLFFSLGIYLHKNKMNVETNNFLLSSKMWVFIFVLITALKTFLAFKMHWGVESYILLSILHKISIISGVISIWFGADSLVEYLMNLQWFNSISSYSFIIYAFHVPLLNYLTRFVFSHVTHFTLFRLSAFVGIPIVIIIFSLIFGIIFRKITPKLYGFCTGGRGF